MVIVIESGMSTLNDNDIRVLLVDDEKDFTDALSRRLSRQGLDVAVAGNAEEAFVHLQDNPVDVILLDVNMPGMDGLQALKVFKNNFSGMEIIMLTGRADVSDAVQSMHVGAFDFLIKPAPFQLVLCKVRDAAMSARLGVPPSASQCNMETSSS